MGQAYLDVYRSPPAVDYVQAPSWVDADSTPLAGRRARQNRSG
jgi:hypothetical protein